MNAADRILARCVETASGCWEWQGFRTEKGYGGIHHNRRWTRTHRVVWDALRGPLPDHLQIDHVCLNKACCNPYDGHCEPVDDAENRRRRALTRRAA